MRNKDIRKILIRKYGDNCMFFAAGCYQMPQFKEYANRCTLRYSPKQINDSIRNLSVHHFKHVEDGGETTEENCCLVSLYAHRFIHTLPKRLEKQVNDEIKRYKKSCRIVFTDYSPDYQIIQSEFYTDGYNLSNPRTNNCKKRKGSSRRKKAQITRQQWNKKQIINNT